MSPTQKLQQLPKSGSISLFIWIWAEGSVAIIEKA